MYQLNLAGTIIAQFYTSSRRQLCARSGHLMILKTMMSQPSFADRSLATNDVIDYFCLNREDLRIAS